MVTFPVAMIDPGDAIVGFVNSGWGLLIAVAIVVVIALMATIEH